MTVKRSVVLNGHKTSVSIEDAFWRALAAEAKASGRSLNVMIAEIDAGRGADNLSSAIRLHVLRALQAKLAALAGAPRAT